MVNFETGDFKQPVPPADVLKAFYDTVACRLEGTRRGSRFPLLLDRLRDGRLSSGDTPAALQELDAIESGLAGLPVSKVMGGPPVPPGANNASRVFAEVIVAMRAALKQSARSGKPLYENNVGLRRTQFYFGVIVVLAGLSWCAFIYLLLPNWYLTSVSDPHPTSGIPIWRLGMIGIAVGVQMLISMASLGVRYWFLRRQWAILTVAVLAALAFAVFGSEKFH